ncbi:NAD+ synthase [Mycoplasmopsis caviae]|uniref:NH(3)-dependent NAD(+) synthetase n=1 Tax=Mycoplasmopsis caviae TaxID=55603 RepID=A0A3P8KWU0_9BACT|nr:NAD+ synthase [Mycoplasmopsis caviae]UUD35279.1 NAD+ synthase [Mycoplasmopsis caviae]VDR41937.1 NAD+ synthetase [Mycoplasmopsis caviae]
MSKFIGLRKESKYESEFDAKKVEKYANYLIEWMRKKVNLAGAKGIVLGISGGIDSAVVVALAKRAFNENVLGVIMPVDSMQSDAEDIKKLEKSVGLKFITVDLKNIYEAIKQAIKKINNPLALSNIKPRLRMSTLYALAQENNYLVAGTGNKCEMHIGYFTKYGDGGSDILPLCKLLKSEVKELAKYLNVPDSIINKKPSAGLWEGQSDEAELGFSYKDLDSYLLDPSALIDQQVKDKIEIMHKNSEHKRNVSQQPEEIDTILNIK